MKTKVAAVVLGLTIAATGIGISTADAAPITCPGPQVAEKIGDWWQCVNPADNVNESDTDRNPNGNPNS
jgi:hypothetical protein